MIMATTRRDVVIGAAGAAFATSNGIGQSRPLTHPGTKGYAIHVTDYGALGDGKTDDGPAIRQAIAACGDKGAVYFAPGQYLVQQDGANPWCLRIPASIKLIGQSTATSVIWPRINISDECDVIHVSPSKLIENRGGGMDNLSVLNPVDGTRAGRDAIRIDTTDSGSINRYRINEIATGSGHGYAIHHVNDPIKNDNGGLYNSLIENSTLDGGISLVKSGDSNTIRNCTLTGNCVGIEIDNVFGASGAASQNVIECCNITASKGAIRIRNSAGLSIRCNNIENSLQGSARSNGSAVIWLSSPDAWHTGLDYKKYSIVTWKGLVYRAVTNSPVSSPPNSDWEQVDPNAGIAIEQNLLANFGSSDAKTLIRIDQGTNISVKNNRIMPGLGGVGGLFIDYNAVGTIVGPNLYSRGLDAKHRVTDRGVGTVGTQRRVSNYPGWADVPGHSFLSLIKNDSGLVTLIGTTGGGVIAPGEKLFAVSRGFCPADTKLFTASCWNGRAFVGAELAVDAEGVCVVALGGTSTAVRVTILASWVAANAADGTI